LNGDGVVISAGINDDITEAVVTGFFVIFTGSLFCNGDGVYTTAARDIDVGGSVVAVA